MNVGASKPTEADNLNGEVASPLNVRVARTFRARAIGLLGRASLSAGEALLLAPGGSIHTFGMRCAIDSVFLSAELTVLRIVANVQPWRFVLAPRRTRFVLELPAGTARCLRLERGMSMRALSPIAYNERGGRAGIAQCELRPIPWARIRRS